MTGAWAQSALEPAGRAAGHIGWLMHILFGTLTGVYLIVMAVLAWAVIGSMRRNAGREPSHGTSTKVVTAAVGVSTGILLFLMVASVSTGRNVSELEGRNQMTVEVTAHQWWWEFVYPDATSSKIVTTANEIHIPAGRKVMLRLQSDDVIHSLWIPNLQGKRDLIPGKVTTTWIEADRPGTYRGQCAEYCGLQHSHMAFMVVVDEPGRFDGWLDEQRKDGAAPQTESQKRGQAVFEAAPCVLCHTVRGTAAMGQVAPDLTHVASRMTIAAGTMPFNRGSLAGWITDSHSMKPGNRMPPISVPPAELDALLDYLESLR